MKYELHIDQGTVLEREIMLLLMGIESPDEFTHALVAEAKITPDAIGGIVQDINAQIFIPLREEEMKSAQAAQMQRPVAPPAPMFRPSAPPLQSPSYPAQANSPQQAEAPVPAGKVYDIEKNRMKTARYRMLSDAIAVGNAAGIKRAVGVLSPEDIALLPPHLRTNPLVQNELAQRPGEASTAPLSMDTSKLLEDHEEPHIEFSKAPPPNLPGQAIPPPAPKAVAPPPLTAYSADPYREPLE